MRAADGTSAPAQEDISGQIELFLLDAGSWVPTSAIQQAFGVPERLLRQDGDRSGLLDHFAVSSTRNGASGYIHHRHLPTAEWLPIKHRLRRHAISELRRARSWDQARRNIVHGPRGFRHETHTGQALLPL